MNQQTTITLGGEQIQGHWQSFTVNYEGSNARLQCKAFIDTQGYCCVVRVVDKVPRGWYYSYFNEAMNEAEKLFKFKD